MRASSLGVLLVAALSLQACTGAPFAYVPTTTVGLSDTGFFIADEAAAAGTVRLKLDLDALAAIQGADDGLDALSDATVTLSRGGTIVDQQTLTANALAHNHYQVDFDEVVVGELDVQVRVYGATGKVLARGSARVSIRADRRVEATVPVRLVSAPASSSGTLPVATPQPSPTPSATPRPLPTLAPLQTLVLARPNDVFISQMQDPTWNPTAPDWTLNCGPASLAMALKAYQLLPPGASASADAQGLIRQTRLAMMGTADDFKLSSLDDLERGAEACGLRHQRAWGLEGVRSALQANQLVIVAGNPIAYNTRYTKAQYSPFDGGHFVLVTGIDGSYVYVNDPLSHVGNLAVSLVEFQHYMAYNSWDVGMAVSRAAR